MLARCPACQTVFRVLPEQLRAHFGHVRCGHCFNPFNALENLLDDSRPVATAVPNPAEPAAPALPPAPAQEPRPAPASAGVGPFAPAIDPSERFFVLEEKTEDNFSDQLDFEIPDTLVASRRAAAPERSDSNEPTRDETLAFVLPRSASDRFSPGNRTLGATDVPIEDRTPATAPVDRAAPSEDSAPREEPSIPCTPSADFAIPPEPDDRIEPDLLAPEPFIPEEPAPKHANVALADTEAHASAPDLDDLDDRYGRPTSSLASRWAWGIAAGVLASTLAAQSVYVFRADIARNWPLLRPALLEACSRIDCTIELPRLAGAISVEASDLQSEPGKPGRFVLNATIRNRAHHPQAFPHLELTLTDTRDRPLARRVLTPQDWAPGADIANGFAAGRDIALTLPFAAAGFDAAGYRIYVFYP